MPNEDKKGTPFDARCEILAELWIEYRGDTELEDFFSYNDIGLPAAYLVESEMAEPSQQLIDLINETFDLLLATLGRENDDGYESLDDILVG
jgi:hypothetical protein